MDLIMIVLVIALVGCLVWAITTYIPMPPVFKMVITILTVVVMILWLMGQLGGKLPNVMH